MEKLYFCLISDKMEASIEFLRSNYVYIQNIRSEFDFFLIFGDFFYFLGREGGREGVGSS